MYLRQRCFDRSVNKIIVKPRVAAAAGRRYVYVWFSRRKIPRSSAYMISEKAIQFRHPDYNPDRAQKLINSSISRHLSTRNISSKSMLAFLSNLANRQTDKHGQKHLPPLLSEVTIRDLFVKPSRFKSIQYCANRQATCRYVMVSHLMGPNQSQTLSLPKLNVVFRDSQAIQP